MQKNPYPGKFIVFDGLDGSVQSTQAGKLVDFLNLPDVKLKFGHTGVHLTKEPTSNLIGGLIRSQLGHEWKSSRDCLQLLFSADRAHHLEKEIIPLLERGVIIVCDRYFFATSGIGFDAHVGKIYDEKPGHSRGILPYFQFAATEFFSYEPQEILLTCNGKTFRYTPFVLTVANVEQYGGGAIIAPGAIPDDGLFDISIILQSHFLEMLSHLPKLFLGTIDVYPYFKSHRASSLTITRPSSGPVHVDGEPFMAGEVLEYVLLPQALNVQVYEETFEKMKYEKRQKVPVTSPDEVLHTIEKLAQLKERGFITEKDFREQKRKLLERL